VSSRRLKLQSAEKEFVSYERSSFSLVPKLDEIGMQHHMNDLERSNKYQNRNPVGHQLRFMVNESSSDPSGTAASASRDGNSSEVVMNGTTTVTTVPTTSETKSENRCKKAEVRLSSVADAVAEDGNHAYRRNSSYSTRNSNHSNTSWPEHTPDPLGPVARCSSSFSVEDIDFRSSIFSSSERDFSVPSDVAEISRAAGANDGAEGGFVLQQHQAHLYDPPHTSDAIRSSYIPTSKSTQKTQSGDSSVNAPTKQQTPLEERLKQLPTMPSRIPPPLSSVPRQYSNGRRRSSFNLGDKDATILFVDVEGYSITTNLTQRHITRAFMNTLRNLLTFCYGTLPSRTKVEDYVILPTGDGAAVVVIRPPSRRVLPDTDEKAGGHNCDGGECGNDNGASEVNDVTERLLQSSMATTSSAKLFGLHCSSCSRISLTTTEETALWIGSSLLLWSESIQIGLRVGLNSGELSIVEDPYGDPNVCGDAINMAARIMDTALPGQILASAGTVVKKLNLMQLECDNGERLCSKCPNMKYEIANKPSEVVVKHGVTTNVQSIIVQLYPLPNEPDQVGGDTGSKDRLASDEIDGVGNACDLSICEQIPAVPLAEIKANKAKRSFASLSSLQPSSSFTGQPRQRNTLSNSFVSANDLFTLKRPSAGTQHTTEAPTATSSSSNVNRRSTLTSVESTQVATSTQLPLFIGNHKTPVTKWYMKVKPTEMKADSGRIKPKVLPQELIRRHHRIAFIGIMHDNLSKAFVNILEEDPQHRWDQVFVLFPSDSCLKNTLVQNYSMQPVEKLIENKNACRSSLHELLSPVVSDLRFLTYDQLMHCGSYWDWCDPGGFIHVSPLTWGANPKTCPAMNYYWNSKVPSPEYRVYRDGLGYLLKTATPF